MECIVSTDQARVFFHVSVQFIVSAICELCHIQYGLCCFSSSRNCTCYLNWTCSTYQWSRWTVLFKLDSQVVKDMDCVI